MQYKKVNYDENLHKTHKALSVHEPYASYIASGEKIFEVRTRNTSYRGDLVICSTARKKKKTYTQGQILCIVELYGVCMFRDLTEEQKKQTCIPESDWERYSNHYAWKLRNARRVIEKPIIGGQGLWTLYCSRHFVMEYPQELGERVLTEAEQVREFAKKVQEIKRKSRRGWRTIGTLILIFSMLIVAIIRVIMSIIDKIA